MGLVRGGLEEGRRGSLVVEVLHFANMEGEGAAGPVRVSMELHTCDLLFCFDHERYLGATLKMVGFDADWYSSKGELESNLADNVVILSRIRELKRTEAFCEFCSRHSSAFFSPCFCNFIFYSSRATFSNHNRSNRGFVFLLPHLSNPWAMNQAIS